MRLIAFGSFRLGQEGHDIQPSRAHNGLHFADAKAGRATIAASLKTSPDCRRSGRQRDQWLARPAKGEERAGHGENSVIF